MNPNAGSSTGAGSEGGKGRAGAGAGLGTSDEVGVGEGGVAIKEKSGRRHNDSVGTNKGETGGAGLNVNSKAEGLGSEGLLALQGAASAGLSSRSKWEILNLGRKEEGVSIGFLLKKNVNEIVQIERKSVKEGGGSNSGSPSVGGGRGRNKTQKR
ncbi:hypothetical protein AX774_g3566 [Zancudomyces culisetae]|uniref:Uncharacterized protein n=1 Tax=Zancudomyces culisetae TaxID=1213189 RepID=A0A1R1PPV1_ZANCU|nr:hypothetical protein AX774_g3566 [Zancudomyces culisetae]|eukprot:OMH82933.1 hypothetical protein AX774_g3566 [Zancudomyces culisetae]